MLPMLLRNYESSIASAPALMIDDRYLAGMREHPLWRSFPIILKIES